MLGRLVAGHFACDPAAVYEEQAVAETDRLDRLAGQGEDRLALPVEPGQAEDLSGMELEAEGNGVPGEARSRQDSRTGPRSDALWERGADWPDFGLAKE